MANIDKIYTATLNNTFTERLLPGYHSAVFTNDSGFYILLRLGGIDIPSSPASANRIIPPYHEAIVRLQGQYIAGVFTDKPSGLVSNLATSVNGICSVVYTTDKLNQNLSPIGGASQAVIQPPVPSYGAWSRVVQTIDLLADRGFIIIDGPVIIRKCLVRPLEEIASSASQILLNVCNTATPNTIGSILDIRPYYSFGAGQPYVQPDVIFEPGIGNELLIVAGQSLAVQSGAAQSSIFTTLEYRNL